MKFVRMDERGDVSVNMVEKTNAPWLIEVNATKADDVELKEFHAIIRKVCPDTDKTIKDVTITIDKKNKNSFVIAGEEKAIRAIMAKFMHAQANALDKNDGRMWIVLGKSKKETRIIRKKDREVLSTMMLLADRLKPEEILETRREQRGCGEDPVVVAGFIAEQEAAV